MLYLNNHLIIFLIMSIMEAFFLNDRKFKKQQQQQKKQTQIFSTENPWVLHL